MIARNQDDHTKNIAFLMNRKYEWKLSPAYDVTFAFDPANKWMKSHQLSIKGKNDAIELKDLLMVAKEMNIKKPAAIIESVLKSVKNWKRYAKSAGVSESKFSCLPPFHLNFFRNSKISDFKIFVDFKIIF